MADSCTPSCGLAGANAVRNPIDIISPIIESGIDPLMVFGPDYPLLPFLFESNLNNDATELIGLKFKDPSKRVSIKYTNGNCAVEWTERYDCRIEANILSVAWSVVTVDDIKKLRGINAGSQLILSDHLLWTFETVTVISVAGNAITVNPAPTLTTATVAKRGAYNPLSSTSCNANASNTYTGTEEGVFESPFRRLRLTMDFNQCDLSLDRYINGDPARAFLNELVMNASQGAKNEFTQAFYFDNGRVMPSTGNINTQQTLGIITGIQFAQTEINKPLIHDFSSCCAGAGTDCEKDEAMVLGFYSILMDMYDTGLYNNAAITAIANKEQMDALRMLNKTFYDVHQITVIYQPSDSFQSIYNGLSVQRIPFGYVNLDIYLDRNLEWYWVPMMILLPAHRLFFAQRPFYDVKSSGNGGLNINKALSSGNPRFKFVDRSEIDGDGTGECMVLKAFLDFAIIPQGMFSGAYRLFLNFKSCSDNACKPWCDTGTLVSPFTFN